MGIAWLRERDDVTTIGVAGHSVGGGAAILAASRDPEIAAIVSMSAFAHPREMMANQLRLDRLPGRVAEGMLWPIEKLIGHQFDDFAPLRRIGEVGCPVLIVHGDADKVIPVKDAFPSLRCGPRRPDPHRAGWRACISGAVRAAHARDDCLPR